MKPADVLERAHNVKDRILNCPRITVTELSRSTEWRKTLPDAGVIEITDRGETSGWLVSDADMHALLEGYAVLEEEYERMQVELIFSARNCYSDPVSGETLIEAVDNVISADGKRILEALNAR